ncbi:MAG: hypothetical protein H6747_03430 [Deltaproteobacteria bacterium]|nr:hypothetical protein [Deltaproteobacteria bacterium]
MQPRRRRDVRPLLALLPLLWLLASPVWAAPEREAGWRCRRDGECSGTLLCLDGRCQQPQCTRDDECAAGRTCRRGACRIRECDVDTDCHISRRCRDGICALPDPTERREEDGRGAAPDADAFDAGLSIGPAFPGGLLAEVDLGVGAGRVLYAGLGTTTDAGGVAWRGGLRVRRGWLGPLHHDVFCGVQGYTGGRGEAGSWAAIGLGSARRFFAAAGSISAAWWTIGTGASWIHGVAGDRVLRLELGAAMLIEGAYRDATNVALLPLFGVRYGLRF